MLKRFLPALALAVSLSFARATSPPPSAPEPPSAVEKGAERVLIQTSNVLNRALAVVVPPSNMIASTTFPLWPEGAPGALGTSSNDIPTLTVYLPTNAATPCPAMIICPGGGYGHLADHEGGLYAQWLNRLGIAGFVLKYRLGTAGYRHPIMLLDATRALRTVRARASQWNVDPARVGIMGSSAGGHLASALLTHFDAGDTASSDAVERASSRPDLGILCYAVITMKVGTHGGSRANLLGTNPPPALIDETSSELHVTSNTPPCFVWTTGEDKTVPPMENSLAFATALRQAGVPVDFHLYERGPHGLGLGVKTNLDTTKLLPWTKDCEYWLKLHNWTK